MDKAEKDAREIYGRLHGHMVTSSLVVDDVDAIAAALRARDEEIARLRNVISSARHGDDLTREIVRERDQDRAERDAAVAALEWVASEGIDDGDIHGFDQFTLAESAIMLLNRARTALAQLPHAGERARLVDAERKALREILAKHPDDCEHIHNGWLAVQASDAQDKGEGGGG